MPEKTKDFELRCFVFYLPVIFQEQPSLIFPLSIEDLVTFLWFGCPEKGGLERENPEGDSELVSLPFPSLIAMNSFSISDDFRF